MTLAEEYARQLAWRDWDRVFARLPLQAGQTVLDLGCAAGDLSARLARQGARVIGIDGSAELIAAARSRALPGCEFRQENLLALRDFGATADGIWCSFAAAYFTDLPAILARWTAALQPGGWIALVEVDDFFAHDPLDSWIAGVLDAYVDEALSAGRYDFRMGRKLQPALERAGYIVETTRDLDDLELAFSGPARPEVLEAWRLRFDRMTRLAAFCGTRFADVRAAFLRCLARADHTSRARVVSCIARVP